MANITTTTAANFIPEVWQPEVRAFLRAELGAVQFFKSWNFEGKAGDTVHVPDVSKLTATAKAADTDVAFTAITETEFNLVINNHFYTAFLLEDLPRIQAAYDLRQEYTSSGAFALAEKMETDTLANVTSLAGADRVIGSDGITAYSGANEADLADAGLRRAKETLMSRNVPRTDLVLIVPPSQENVLLGISRFSEYQMTGEAGEQNAIKSGYIGQLYGMKVFVSNLLPAGASTDHYCIMAHKNSFVLVRQLNVRVQADYLLEKLGWGVVMDTVYDTAIFRSNSAIGLVVPD